MAPADPLYVLWSAFLRLQNGSFDAAEFEQQEAESHFEGLIAVVGDLYLGKSDIDHVRGKASSMNNPEAVCEADFYSAEWLLAQRKSIEAKPLFEEAVQRCPASDADYAGASRVELKRSP